MEKPSVRPDSGLFLEFAPIERDMTRSLAAQEDGMRYCAVRCLDELLTVFDKDTAHTLDYWLDASLFSEWRKPAVRLPFYPDVIRRDVQLYTSRGISFVTSFGAYLDRDYTDRYGEPPVAEYGRILSEK